MNSLSRPATTAVQQCLQLRADESIAIVTDDERLSIGKALYQAGRAVTDAAVLLSYPPGEQHGVEPPSPVAAAMRSADAFLAPTTKSLSHTSARIAACEAGARGATLPGITEDVFVTGLDADYEAIETACSAVHEQVVTAETVRIESPAGTDLTIEPGDREWRSDTGAISDPGSFSNLPAGEVFVSPETANGTVVVDGTMMPHGLLDDQLQFTVADGYVSDISDDAVREMVQEAAESVGNAASNLAEVGIGTNVGVTDLIGSVLLDEKAAGTVHVAIGDDHSIGGDVEAPIHLDGIIRNPTVSVDGEPIDLPTPDA